MNVHFIYPLAKRNWALINELEKKIPGASFDCAGEEGFSNYSRRFQLLLRHPRLVKYAYKSYLSMTRRKNSSLADIVVVGSDMEAIGCILARAITRTTSKIVLTGFIYTPRKNPILRILRKFYFKLILSQLDGVICYSNHETNLYREIFRLKKTKFTAIHFGGNVSVPSGTSRTSHSTPRYIVSAGRSGRDYQLLCDSVRDSPFEVHIICDANFAIDRIDFPNNVKMLRNCYGKDYLNELTNAELVVLPLKNDGISSGQMVLVDAMALAKTVIITRTSTTIEYGQHMKTCFFISPNSIPELKNALKTCMNKEIRSAIGSGAKAYYHEHHSIEAYTQSLKNALKEILEFT